MQVFDSMDSTEPQPISSVRQLLGPGAIVAGKLRILGLLGRGGMGEVYVAHHLHMRRDVALKVICANASADITLRARFAREVMALSQLDSPYVAKALDSDVLEDGSPYLVMQLLEGHDLRRELTERGPLPIDEAVTFLRQACLGVGEAHRRGVTHRDLKPQNLFLTSEGGERRIVLLDFGVAKLQAMDDSSLTQAGSMPGTTAYMAPEQLLENRSGPQSDLWSLGIILYELLTNRKPFTGATNHALAFSITPKVKEFRVRFIPGKLIVNVGLELLGKVRVGTELAAEARSEEVAAILGYE